MSAPSSNVFVSARDRSASRRSSGSEGVSRERGLGTWIFVALSCGLGLVGIGLWLRAPGLAILYVFVVSPAILALVVSQERRERRGTLESVGNFIDTYFSALVKTIVLLSLLSLATFFALCLFCFVVVFTASRR